MDPPAFDILRHILRFLWLFLAGCQPPNRQYPIRKRLFALLWFDHEQYVKVIYSSGNCLLDIVSATIPTISFDGIHITAAPLHRLPIRPLNGMMDQQRGNSQRHVQIVAGVSDVPEFRRFFRDVVRP